MEVNDLKEVEDLQNSRTSLKRGRTRSKKRKEKEQKNEFIQFGKVKQV